MTTDKYNVPEDDPGYSDGPLLDIEDHEYDEIKELDNPPPGWIMAVFYLTIGISILYGAYYFWLRVGDKQEAEYAKSVEKARLKYQKEQPAGELTLLTDAASLTAGKDVYTAMNCATCHGAKAEGNVIGPNLTDNYWLHGCKFEEVFNLIKNGFPTKGMTAFKAQLPDEKIRQVTSYVISLKGSDPAGAKAPQGEPCN
jgi:cytochrome c oxidase cbb3-type subunit 3